MHAHQLADQWLFGAGGSRLYNHLFARAAGPLYRRVAEDIGALAPVESLLDVGCGPGQLVCDVARRSLAQRALGLDISPPMVARAEENARRQGLQARARFEVGDVRRLPYGDGSFDLIVSTLSLHHWPEVEGPLRELYRVLRPGGRLWIYDFALVKPETVLAPASATAFGSQAAYGLLRVGLLPPFARWTLWRS